MANVYLCEITKKMKTPQLIFLKGFRSDIEGDKHDDVIRAKRFPQKTTMTNTIAGRCAKQATTRSNRKFTIWI